MNLMKVYNTCCISQANWLIVNGDSVTRVFENPSGNLAICVLGVIARDGLVSNKACFGRLVCGWCELDGRHDYGTVWVIIVG